MPVIAAQKGSEVAVIFDVLGLDGVTPQTGKAGTITTALRDESGAAAESVTVAEQGSSGYYKATFTPTAGDSPPVTYMLRVQEPAGTMQRVLEWTIQVYDALPAIAGATGNLTTLANVRQVLGLAAGDTGDDAYLTNLIGRVSEWFKRYTRRCLTQTTLTEIHDGKRRSRLRLDDYPVISFTSLHESPDQVWDATTLIDSGDYVVDTRLGWLTYKYDARFFRYPQSLRAVYVAGYASIPLDLELAAIDLTVTKYRRRRNEGVVSRSLADGSITVHSATEMTDYVRHVADLYKKAA